MTEHEYFPVVFARSVVYRKFALDKLDRMLDSDVGKGRHSLALY